jgi:hypothetical protein
MPTKGGVPKLKNMELRIALHLTRKRSQKDG